MKTETMKKFNRRTYPSLMKLLSDVSKIFSERKKIQQLMGGELIDKPFRERLMLAVTSVNQCLYCSYVHSELAFKEGISIEEIGELCDGYLDKCPQEELPALLYAQHWAESEGRPQPEIRQHILDTYGEEKADAIELSIRMIHTANLLGNTLDLILYKLTFGYYNFKRNPGKACAHIEYT